MGLQANPKLGSLFDGSGGFPLAGAMCGIEPVWASEVEPYPIAVTRERFPNMKHLGDISKINGAEIEPVDIITFGSPCQDLSVAGKRAGLKHESNGDEETTRSGLFMEAVRIIKEMRDATNGVLPRFALWENVPGAFSSNKGEDFRIVLEELIKIAEPDAVMPPVPEKGWAYADCYIGDGWSIAYRVFDAQYWGVPQRRRRIHLVCDFGGQCAGEVSFKREGLRGYSSESGNPWQGIAPDAQGNPGATNCERIGIGADLYNQVITGDIAATLSANSCMTATRNGPSVIQPIIRSLFQPVTFEPGIAAREGGHVYDGVSGTLRANAGDNQMSVAYVIDQGGGKSSCSVSENLSPTLCTTHGGEPAVVYALDRASFNQGQNAKFDFEIMDSGINYTLTAREPSAGAYRQGDFQTYQKVSGPLMANSHPGSYTGQDAFSDMLVAGEQKCANEPQYIVRRLTPTECARLQGFPDWWGHISEKTDMTDEEHLFWLEVRNTHARINGKVEKEYTKKQMLSWYNKLHTDSAEYKMWGNGIALPPALYVMQGIVDVLDNQKTK